MNLNNYNKKYFIEGQLWQLKPHRKAINTYITQDGIVIGMFQGRRGQHPDIDFIIRVLKPGTDETPFPPPHTYWVVDLLMKIQSYKTEVMDIIEYYIKFYDEAKPFSNPDSRISYQPQTKDYISKKYQHLEQTNTLSLEYVAIIVELFCLNEKRNNNAYMFRDLLVTLLNYTKG